MDSLSEFRPPPAPSSGCGEELLEQLCSATPEELRTSHLPLLFSLLDIASDHLSPQITAVVRRAFQGEEGVAALRSASILPYLLKGVDHSDPLVRAHTLDLLVRLSQSEGDVKRLCEGGVSPKMAHALSDPSLKVSESAARVFVAAAEAGINTLRQLLDEPTVASLIEISKSKDQSLQLRYLSLVCEMGSKGDAALALCCDLGLLVPVLVLWQGSDPLVRLNVIEIMGGLALSRGGFEWVNTNGIVRELCEIVDTRDCDAYVELQRPAALHCLANLLEAGGEAAVTALLEEQQLLSRVWPHLTEAAAAGEHSSALAVLRAAAASPTGMEQLLKRETPGLQPLPALMRSSDERTKLGAYSVAAQLCATAAVCHSDSLCSRMGVLQSLVNGAATSPSTSASDAIAQVATNSFSDGLRMGALSLLQALTGLQWGAAALCSSESVIELLLGASVSFSVSPEELRMKHTIAQHLAAMPVCAELLGANSPVLQSLKNYASAGPFQPQRPRATRVAAPLTL
ncbi:MAG: hypothetical protein SGPRY_014150, partial [Prymnesium sp.]